MVSCQSTRIISRTESVVTNHKKTRQAQGGVRWGGGIEGGWCTRNIRIFHFRPTSRCLSHLTNDPTPNPASDTWDSHVRASAAAPHPTWKVSPRTRGNPLSTDEGSPRTTSCYVAAGLAGARRSCHSTRMGDVFPARFSRYSESCPRHVDGCLGVAATSLMRAWIQMRKMGRSARVRAWAWAWRRRQRWERVQVQVQWRETCAFSRLPAESTRHRGEG
jgi:hypothetical protein